jgi:hypothetical protein
MKQRMKDPEYRKGLRAQVRITIKSDYRRLAQELGCQKEPVIAGR